MTQRLTFIPDRTYANQVALNSQLDTLNTANPISLICTNGSTQPDIWARLWAQGKGIPWIDQGTYLDAAGYVNPFDRSLANMLVSKPDQVLTAGTGAHPTAAVAIATKRCHLVTKL